MELIDKVLEQLTEEHKQVVNRALEVSSTRTEEQRDVDWKLIQSHLEPLDDVIDIRKYTPEHIAECNARYRALDWFTIHHDMLRKMRQLEIEHLRTKPQVIIITEYSGGIITSTV